MKPRRVGGISQPPTSKKISAVQHVRPQPPLSFFIRFKFILSLESVLVRPRGIDHPPSATSRGRRDGNRCIPHRHFNLRGPAESIDEEQPQLFHTAPRREGNLSDSLFELSPNEWAGRAENLPAPSGHQVGRWRQGSTHPDYSDGHHGPHRGQGIYLPRSHASVGQRIE